MPCVSWTSDSIGVYLNTCHEIKRSVVRAHRVESELTEWPVCRGFRRGNPWFVEPRVLSLLSHEYEEGCCNCSRKLSVGFKEEVMRVRIRSGDKLSVIRDNGVFSEPTELCRS